MRGARALWAALLLAAPALGSAGGEFLTPGAREKCPVCGMFVARYPQWTCGVRWRDGTHAVFDGPKDLLKFWLDPARYGARTRDGVVAVFVTDYYAVRQVDAKTAWYVVGSDVFGPMGRELVPFATEQDARGFLKDHRGRRLLRFDEVTSELLRELDG